jgi:hypothetical protein
MTPDTVLIIVLAALSVAAVPFVVWLRAQRRIRHLEMTLLAQSVDSDRYEELRTLLQQLAAQTEQLTHQQSVLAERLEGGRELLAPPKGEHPRAVTPH